MLYEWHQVIQLDSMLGKSTCYMQYVFLVSYHSTALHATGACLVGLQPVLLQATGDHTVAAVVL